MKAFVPNYNLLSPKNLVEALSILDEKKLKVFAGGTDLMVLFEAGKLPPGDYLSLYSLVELQGISENKDEIIIGALTTYMEIRENLLLQSKFPLLVSAAKATGAIAIQNRGTIGGNIANASPAADSVPALMSYEAKITLKSKEGTRKINLCDFYQGYKKFDLRSDEIIISIHLPLKNFEGVEHLHYHKVGTREGQAISKVCFSLRCFIKDKKISYFKLALGSVAPTTVLAKNTEKLLLNQKMTASIIKKAQSEILKDISPIDDIRSSAVYRRKVVQNLLKFYLEKINS